MCMNIDPNLRDPPREFSLIPFWFLNDTLDDDRIRQQIADFDAHGVYGFVLHPRMGLAKDCGWMSQRLLGFMNTAVEEAERRGMKVALYDEGMYPSGSSAGQIVQRHPHLRSRCLAKIDLADASASPVLPADANLIAVLPKAGGGAAAIIDRPVDSVIRGLHYIDEQRQTEEEPLAADLLNPQAVACFIELVYEKFHQVFGRHFGRTIIGIFTDEPAPLSRCREKNAVPGTTGIIAEVSRILGYDFTPFLPCLWSDDAGDAERRRRDYHHAISIRFEETYYAPLSAWCAAHGVNLMGHPAKPDDYGTMRFFNIPGQDLVWRYVVPANDSALVGSSSTTAKCASSALAHDPSAHRCCMECFGAYGEQFTEEEMGWLANWCFVRGINMLAPHAFYYSIRGPRKQERPPDVGPNSPWWNDYKKFADHARRLSWVNSDCRLLCDVAVLGLADHLPFNAAGVCFQNQIDFNYIEIRELIRAWEAGGIDAAGIRIAAMRYTLLIVDGDRFDDLSHPLFKTLNDAGMIVRFNPPDEHRDIGQTARSAAELLSKIDARITRDLRVQPACPSLRVRHVVKDSRHYYLCFNEAMDAIGFVPQARAGSRLLARLDPTTLQCDMLADGDRIRLDGGQLVLLLGDPT